MNIPQFWGYGIVIVLGWVFFKIASLVTEKEDKNNINTFILANRSMSWGFIAASVLTSWTWTTTIMGAAEAGMWYGFSGGISYSLGAGLPFLVLIPVILRLRAIMPDAITYTEFIGERYGYRLQQIYYVFAVAVVLYVFLEQLVGIALVFNNIFGISFKITVALMAFIVTLYIVKGGIKGFFYNNLLHFVLICILISAIFYFLTKSINLDFIYTGLSNSSRDIHNVNFNPSTLMVNSMAGFKYGVISVAVAVGQLLLDQGYYTIGMASKSRRTLLWGFLLGILVWMPVSIICANIFGHTAIALGLGSGHGIKNTTDIATYILATHCSPYVSFMFALLICSIGISTGSNCLAGILTIFAVDFYKSKIKDDANDAEKIKFGRIITVCIAALCAMIAIAMEGISLLKIDMFSGIFFAAPCGSLIAGLFSARTNETTSIISIFTGLILGILVWLHFGISIDSWFYGCITSLLFPIVMILLLNPFSKNRFNFTKLHFYRAK